ncbi:SMP-30/gluconolactonase/LRE family protein [Fulvimarina endophytica]|uniref:SMP-30/gluconolactonase/LRE family protein n=1 Tax=Fulvimarina endophytica TaxID=2293836 RepID=A0A371X045_9HYPH|nr:SMP-30/gluconolactonase/LRE family protein [Fulvimarina endophytica]RFC62610.1 SMP-30/gluconolactonase/LRE family protein [Fulvimarina endophytica]
MADETITILDRRRLELGEGPSYDALTDTVHWIDILGRTLYEMPMETRRIAAHPLPRMASEIHGVDEHRQIMAMDDGLYLRDRASGALELHLPLEADDPQTRSNDGNVHPSGALWIGTMGRRAETGAGAIYHYRKGRITKLFGNISIPNGICFSPDGATGYFCDTATNHLLRVAVDPLTGLPTGEPNPFHDQTGQSGHHDGACTASDGTIFIASWGGRAVLVLSPEGEVVRRIDVPASQPTCPAFIGRRADRMILTTAWEHMTPDEISLDEQAGMTFLLNPGVLGVGLPHVEIA